MKTEKNPPSVPRGIVPPATSLRDEIAMRAMQGLITGAVTANYQGSNKEDEYEDNVVAESAYTMADAMLKARKE